MDEAVANALSDVGMRGQRRKVESLPPSPCPGETREGVYACLHAWLLMHAFNVQNNMSGLTLACLPKCQVIYFIFQMMHYPSVFRLPPPTPADTVVFSNQPPPRSQHTGSVLGPMPALWPHVQRIGGREAYPQVQCFLLIEYVLVDRLEAALLPQLGSD